MGVRGDFLVIGSGIAGLRATMTLAEVGAVVVLTKADPRESNTGYAQGGIAAAVGPDDSPELHARDTRAAGDGLCRDEAVDVLVREGPGYVRELVEWGADFDRDAHGALALGREAAHSVRRVLHARDATGREIGRVLWQRAASHPRVTVLDDALALDLVVRDGRCIGVTYLDREGQQAVAESSRTLVATGGAGQVFRETTNPAIASGDGVAMAAEAGARVADLEFVQFHPTVLSVDGAPRFLLSEALRGEGGHLVNQAGERFVHRDDPAGELAPRDVVARAIVKERVRTEAPVYLSMAHLEPTYVRERFPTIAKACRDVGLDIASDRIPVSPAAHYLMGGVETDLDGRTSIEGLFAAGEAACTGLHGANRLASNSLLEGLVFGARAALAMTQAWRSTLASTSDSAPVGHQGCEWPDEQRVRDLMWARAGLIRDREGLEQALHALAGWRSALARREYRDGQDARELRRLSSLVTVGYLVVRAALRREESRGAHFRSDFPSRDDIHWRKHVSDRLTPVN